MTYQSHLALKEHMIQGHRVTVLEAFLIFGVQSFHRAITSFKRDGFLVKSEKVPMAKAIRRTNEYTVCKPPNELPIREIIVTEYWFSNT